MTENTHAVEYTGTARAYRHTATGRTATPADPRIEGLPKADADELVANHPFEHAAPEEPDESDTQEEPEHESDVAELMDGTLADLDTMLESGEYDDRLVELFNYEQSEAGQDREGAYERIQDRRDELREHAQADESESEE